MRMLEGKKQYVEDIQNALNLVREKFPGATKEGSLCSYSFWHEKILVGEAWSHRTKIGWWLRIKTPSKT